MAGPAIVGHRPGTAGDVVVHSLWQSLCGDVRASTGTMKRLVSREKQLPLSQSVSQSVGRHLFMRKRRCQPCMVEENSYLAKETPPAHTGEYEMSEQKQVSFPRLLASAAIDGARC